MIQRLFLDHPASVGETYGQHFVFASRFGLRMIAGGAACCVHGLLPFLFTRTGSRTVLALHERMQRSSGRKVRASGQKEPEYAI